MFTLLVTSAIGQSLPDSVRLVQYDSLMKRSIHRADSITQHFQSKADSLHHSPQSLPARCLERWRTLRLAVTAKLAM